MLIEDIKQELIRKTVLNDDLIEMLQDNFKPFQGLMARYRCAMMEIETKLKVLDEQFSFEYDRNPIEGIKTRLKTPEGILKKGKRKKIPMTLEEIEKNVNDIAGVRVICSFPEDIYIIASCLLEQDDIRLIKLKDYIKEPKVNGYRSLHIIVEVPIFLQNEKRWMKVEIQLRTIAMDFWASLEHKVRYKKELGEEIEKEVMQDLIECAEISSSLDQRMEEIKNRIYEMHKGKE